MVFRSEVNHDFTDAELDELRGFGTVESHKAGAPKEAYIPYSAIIMARVTGDRKLDLSAEIMAKIQKQIETCPASEHLYDLLMNLAAMDENDQKLFFGESLPHGIVIKE